MPELPESGASPARVPANGYEGDLEIINVGPEDFEPDILRRVYRLMLTSRRLDEKMLTLLKQGKGHFHIGTSGHEAVQAAIGTLIRPGHDWASMYYRDMTLAMAFGVKLEDVLLNHYSKGTDPFSGGRQMSEHWSSPELNILVPSSAVGAQFLPGVGLGMAIQRRKEDAFVYISGGDGSTSQGAFHEALNWAAKERVPALFHVQDNKYAISVPTVKQTAGGTVYKIVQGYDGLARCRVDGTDFFQSFSAAKAAIDHLRRGDGPVCIVSDVVRLLPHSSSDSHVKYRTQSELEADKLVDPILRFEKVCIQAGLLTDERAAELKAEVKRQVDEAVTWVESQPDPDPESVTKHVLFEGTIDLDYEASVPSGEPIVMVDAINHALHEEMARDERIIVYGQDVAGGKGGVFTATRGLTATFGEERCFNSPLAENMIVGTAVGLAAAGFKPVTEIQFGDYIWPAMQQLRNVLPSVRYRSNGTWEAPVVIRVPVGGFIHGGPYHSQCIEAIFGHTPGYQIAMPSNSADAKGLLKTAIRMNDPVLFLEHKSLYRQGPARRPEPDADYLIPFGKASILREGSALTVVTYGAMVYKCMAVAKTLAKEGIDLEVIDLRTIVPLDMECVLASIQKTGRAVIVHEDQEFIGLGAEITAQIMAKGFEFLDAPVTRVAGLYTPVPFSVHLELAMLPSNDDVMHAVRQTLAY